MLSPYMREVMQSLGKSSATALLSAQFGFAAAIDNQTLIAAGAAGSRIVVERLEITVGAAGTIALYTGPAAGTRITGDMVVPTGVQVIERLLVGADAAALTCSRVTSVAIAGRVLYRVLS